MNRIHAAGFALLASAFVLAGLLAVQWGPRLAMPQADAALVIARDNFTLLTAQTRDGEEALFVLDNASGTLLVYSLSVSNRRMDLLNGQQLTNLFAQAGGGENERR